MKVVVEVGIHTSQMPAKDDRATVIGMGGTTIAARGTGWPGCMISFSVNIASLWLLLIN